MLARFPGSAEGQALENAPLNYFVLVLRRPRRILDRVDGVVLSVERGAAVYGFPEGEAGITVTECLKVQWSVG